MSVMKSMKTCRTEYRHPQLIKQNSSRWKYLLLTDLRIERKIEGVSPVEPGAPQGWRIADGEIPNIRIGSPRQVNADC